MKVGGERRGREERENEGGTRRGEKRETGGGGREGQTCYHSTIYADYILTQMRGCAALPLAPKTAQRLETIRMLRRFSLASPFVSTVEKTQVRTEINAKSITKRMIRE